MSMPLICCDAQNTNRQLTASSDARVPKDKIAGVYDRIAPIYDIWGKLTESKARSRAIEIADINDGEAVLEVAVGTGLAFYEIVKGNPNGINTGVDLSVGMLGVAKKRLKDFSDGAYTLGVGDAFNLNIESNSIDVLVNNYMFDLVSFSEMDKIITEFKRVLKANGKLVLVNMTKGERFGSGIYDLVYNVSPKTMGGCRGVMLADRLESNGFQVQVREYYQQMLFPSEVILALK